MKRLLLPLLASLALPISIFAEPIPKISDYELSVDIGEKIEFKRVRKAAKLAQIDDFISNSSAKYDTLVGERGLKISGGQKQRIGIARALYNTPDVLILDEATSALDQETERLVMESITKINKKMTIIIVAHRLRTMKYCNRVIKLKKGEIVFDGKPSEIINDL